jgi:hypothetical protein
MHALKIPSVSPFQKGRTHFRVPPLVKGDEGGFARPLMSIPKGHCCNLDVYKTPFVGLRKPMGIDGTFPVQCGFFSVSIDLENRPVMGVKLAYILNAWVTRTSSKTATSAKV